MDAETIAGGPVDYTEDELRTVRTILKQVVKMMLEIGRRGMGSVQAEEVREMKSLSRGLARVRLRRLSGRLGDLADHLGSLSRGKSDGNGELAMLLTDCLQTAKFVKMQLGDRTGRDSRVVLDEVFECRWSAADLTPLQDLVLVELAVESFSLAKTHRVDVRHYLALESGMHYLSREEMLFPESEDRLPARPSDHPLVLRKGWAFPGYPPREIRIEDHAVSGEPAGEGELRKVLAWASPSVAHCRRRFVKSHQNYFAPLSTPAILIPHIFVTRGREVFLMDDQGDMLRIDRGSGAQGVRFLRALPRLGVEAVFGRCFVDGQGILSLAPLSVIVLKNERQLIKL